MKLRHAVLALALVTSAALAFFGDKEPESAVVESVERPMPVPVAPASPAQSAAAPAEGPAVMRLIPREELIGQLGSGEGGAFHTHSWTPPAPALPPPPPPPPQAPSAPPIPFLFIGKTLGEGRWEVHLSQGERVQTVRAGDVIDGVWRIDTVAPPTMTMTYLPLGQVQQLNIGANE